MKKRVELCKKNSFVLTVLSVCSVFAVLFMSAGPVHSEQTAVVATVAADWSSGAHSTISVDPVGGPRTAQNDLYSTGSDITVSAYGEYFYRFERFGANNVTKFDINAPDTVIWQFSTDEVGDTDSNPYGLVFVSSDKAYLLRYGSTKAWIVNPSTTTEAGFKIGELDLSSYADTDGVPEMAGGVIVGNKLFIILQRLEGLTPLTPYVAVFDITTDTEIDTGIANPILGIPLDIRDPLAIQYLAENNTIYVQGIGSYSLPTYMYEGGIVSIDPDTYATAMVLDDGTSGSHPYGQISGMAIVSAAKGYFVGYASWGHNTLYSFDPATGVVGSSVAGLVDKSIAGMESGVYLDDNDMLWICNQTDARVDILNITDDSIDESVSTNLNPLKVVFCDGTAGTGSGDGDSSSCFISTSACGL